jgi:hypothetical protein
VQDECVVAAMPACFQGHFCKLIVWAKWRDALLELERHFIPKNELRKMPSRGGLFYLGAETVTSAGRSTRSAMR